MGNITAKEYRQALREFSELVIALGDEKALSVTMYERRDKARAYLEEWGYTFHIACMTCEGTGEDETGSFCLDCEGAGNILPEDL